MAAGPIPALSAAVLLRLGCPAGDPATRPLRVLVAEADPSRRLQLRTVLEAAGVAVLACARWEEALGLLMREPVDAALLALELPGAGGAGA
ncbi:MAG TPA: hypothetical protein VE684_05215, partial [Crenalkalicoccus sp.]|nr:hypothetical protein [Crenalkalicoccus sp.]